VSVAPQLAVGFTSQAIDDTSFSVFQSVQNPLATTLIAGNFFAGLQGYCAVVVPIGELKGLDRGATIETALTGCAVTFRAAGNWTAGGTISCNVMLDDSPRAGPLDSRLAWKPPGGFGPNIWRNDGWGVFDQRLEDTGGTPFIDNGLGDYSGFAFEPVVGLRRRMAGKFTVPAGPSWSVARAICQMRRFNTPTGSMEVAIQGNVLKPGGVGFEPDGVDLGVSAPVLNSTLSTAAAGTAITYAFAPDVVLPAGDYWTVMRPSVPYVPDLTNFVSWMQKRQFLGVGGAHFHTLAAVSRRFDNGNYPGHVDVHFDTLAKEAGTPIVWNPIARTTGQSISSPDLSPLVQEVIRHSGHETTSALCFTFRTVGETRTYRFAAHGHPTLAAPGFACQFRRRNTRGEVT